MFNMLLDRLPSDYKGYLIRTDYRIGIQISLALDDPELNENDRVMVALSLLFGAGMPPIDVALEGLQWFIQCGDDKEIEPGGKRLLWFDYDAARL